jgi:hypothetical protein
MLLFLDCNGQNNQSLGYILLWAWIIEGVDLLGGRIQYLSVYWAFRALNGRLCTAHTMRNTLRSCDLILPKCATILASFECWLVYITDRSTFQHHTGGFWW